MKMRVRSRVRVGVGRSKERLRPERYPDARGHCEVLSPQTGLFPLESSSLVFSWGVVVGGVVVVVSPQFGTFLSF